MDTTLEDQVHLVPDPMVSHQHDSIGINQDDDFDFEIDGDDGFDLTGEADNEDDDVIDQVEVKEDQDGQSYHSQQEELQASVPDSHVDEGHEYSDEESDAAHLGCDGLTETAELTQDAQIDNQNDNGVVGQEEAMKNIETVTQEEIYYEETAGEFEDVDDNAVQPELAQDHDFMNTATSVSQVHEGYDLEERTHEADDDAETKSDTFQKKHLVAETAQNIEIVVGYENEDHDQTASIAAQAKSGDPPDDSIGAMLAKNDDTVEAGAETLNESNWGEEENDDDADGPNTCPIVTVSYRGQEYSLFAQSPEDDPDTYFLDGVESIHRPLGQFLGDVREVIASEIEAGRELFARIDGLGLEFGESTAKDFLDQTTLAQIIEVNDKLSQNDGGSQHAELYIFLSLRSSPMQRFAELAKGAEKGQGLSYFEQYYEESPANVSLFDEEEQHEASQPIVSDGLSPDEPHGESEQTVDGAGNFLNAQLYQNPFQVDDQHLSLDDEAISEALGTEVEQVEIEPDTNTGETQTFDDTENGSEDYARADDDNSFELVTTNMQTKPEENAFGNATTTMDQLETQMDEDWAHDDGVEPQDGPVVTEAEEVIDEQTEAVIDDTEESHEQIEGKNPFSLSDALVWPPALALLRTRTPKTLRSNPFNSPRLSYVHCCLDEHSFFLVRCQLG